jgi:hypothetical protein
MKKTEVSSLLKEKDNYISIFDIKNPCSYFLFEL